MKSGFKRGLESYNEIAKDEAAEQNRGASKIEASLDASSDEKVDEGPAFEAAENLDAVLAWHLKKQAERGATDVEAQQRIYELQAEKQGVMRRLHQELAALDRKGDAPPVSKDARRIEEKNGTLVWVHDGKERKTSLGELITDASWGIEYDLDGETVPRLARKRLIIERARRDLEALLDEQIFEEEITSERTHEWRRGAFERLRESRDSGELPFGLLAEKMLSQFMQKLAIDKKLPYKVVNADVYQDVIQKMDFIIKKKEYGRGVNVEADDTPDAHGIESKGVQFTLNRNEEVIAKKRKQIARSKADSADTERVDDIMLVVMRSEKISEAFEKWEKKGRPPGGPDKFLTSNMREHIFMELLRGMDTDEELVAEWKRAQKGGRAS